MNTAQIRAQRRVLSRKLRKASASEVMAAARRFHRDGQRFPAAELILHHPAALASIGPRELEEFGRGMASWGDVDLFACYLAGPAWRDDQVPDRVIHAWARRDDRWWRRAALVATVMPSRAGQTKRTIAVCALLVADRDDMVVKALSWALRELTKRAPAAVRRFLRAHDVAARVRREVTNKLRTGLKNPRRQSTVSRAATHQYTPISRAPATPRQGRNSERYGDGGEGQQDHELPERKAAHQ